MLYAIVLLESIVFNILKNVKKNNNSNLYAKPILTTKEAAKLLRVGVQTVKNYIYQGKIKSFKTPGGHHRILQTHLFPHIKNTFLAELRNGAQNLARNNHLAKFDSLYQAYALTIKAFLHALSARDVFTKGHSERVANYSLSIAEELNLSDKERKTLELAALLHDVGKIGISRQILSKPAPLSAKESLEVKRHPELGEEMVKEIDFLNQVRPLIRHHHERYDGNGYPDRLQGEAIPMGARIIFVAETYDALTSDLPYRPALPLKKAVAELNRVAGAQLDANIVSACVSKLSPKG